jgi:hypothetical protein
MNISLKLKWVWKLYQNDDVIWAQLIRAKYPAASEKNSYGPTRLVVLEKLEQNQTLFRTWGEA